MKNYIVDFNALRITTDGAIEPIWINDFDSEDCLSEALGDESAEFVEMEWPEELQTVCEIAGFQIGIFGDFYGEEVNPIMQSVLGDADCEGNVVLCQYEDGNYLPCTNYKLENLLSIMQVLVGLPVKSVKAALDCFRIAGQDELEEGQELYKQGRYEEAHQCFRQSAKLECPDGVNALAMDYIYGEGIMENVSTGKEILQQAIDMGSAKAYLNLGFYCLDGLYGLAENPDMALQCFEAAAKAYEPKAMAWLGYMYMLEDYDFYNTAKAAYWIRRAVELDCADGWKFLGMLIMMDDYYGYQPAYIRYCFRMYADMEGVSMDAVIEEAGAEDIAEAIWAAVPVEPVLPPVPMNIIWDDIPSPTASYEEAWDLLADEDTVEEGMQLLLQLADMGYAPACRDAGTYMVDCGQEDEFLYDEEGEISAFPADEESAYRYLKMAALSGDTHAMRFMPFLFEDMDIEEARLFISLYIQVTGDWLMESTIAPFLEKVRQMDEAIPWVYPKDFFGSEELAEEAFHLYDTGTGELPGLDAIYKIYSRYFGLQHPSVREKEIRTTIEENLNYLTRVLGD